MSNASEQHPTRTEQRHGAVAASAAPRRLLRIADVSRTTGLSSAGLYKLIRQGLFPAPIKLTARSSAWLATEVDRWIDARAEARDHKHAA
jgi:prophage regulatory protein